MSAQYHLLSRLGKHLWCQWCPKFWFSSLGRWAMLAKYSCGQLECLWFYLFNDTYILRPFVVCLPGALFRDDIAQACLWSFDEWLFVDLPLKWPTTTMSTIWMLESSTKRPDTIEPAVVMISSINVRVFGWKLRWKVRIHTLRQRMAWALTQILVISPGAIAHRDHTEWIIVCRVLYYDNIFVRHAFGNYFDILKEVTYCTVPSPHGRNVVLTIGYDDPDTSRIDVMDGSFTFSRYYLLMMMLSPTTIIFNLDGLFLWMLLGAFFFLLICYDVPQSHPTKSWKVYKRHPGRWATQWDANSFLNK